MKVLFVLYKRSDLTHEQALAEWSGPRHTSIVSEVPGLKKWVQNHVVEVPSDLPPMGSANYGSIVGRPWNRR